MLIILILTVLYNVFSLLTSPINIPNLPEEVQEIANAISEYVSMGIGILSAYTDLRYLVVLFGVILAIDIGIGVYKFVMWVIRKIPIANIS